MKTTNIAIPILALAAFASLAQAQDVYAPPAPAAVPVAAVGDQQPEERAATRALAARRQKMIDDCERNHGSETDCERESDTELRAEVELAGGNIIHLMP